MFLQAASTLTPRSLCWLWPDRLALGKLAILDGDPGLGKSMVALDLCARLSTGRPLPDDSSALGVCSSIYLNAEDGAHDTITPRLLTLGADLDRIFVMNLEHDSPELLSLPTHTARLDDALTRTAARLVVLDPV